MEHLIPRQPVAQAHQLLSKNSVYYYTKKVVVIVLEITSYVLALTLLIGLFAIPTEFVIGSMDMNESVHVKQVWEIEQVTAVMTLIKIIGGGFVLLFLLMGLLLGYTRRKDNRLRQAALLLENALAPTQKTV